MEELELISPTKISLFLGVFLGVSFLVIIAIMLDLWDGVYTAKKLKQPLHSHKLRVTIEKMSEYWRFLIIGFLVDCLGILFDFYALPFAVMLFGLGLIIIEVKSMFEHAGRRKSATTQIPEIVSEIIQCAQEKDAEAIIKKLNKMSENLKK